MLTNKTKFECSFNRVLFIFASLIITYIVLNITLFRNFQIITSYNYKSNNDVKYETIIYYQNSNTTECEFIEGNSYFYPIYYHYFNSVGNKKCYSQYNILNDENYENHK